MEIIVKDDPICPICGEAEKVRAFKVGDKHGWWSQCMNHHDKGIAEVGEVTPTGWFVDDLIEAKDITGKVHLLKLG
jgi:hypothetical protein